MRKVREQLARRSFLSRLGAGAAAFGATSGVDAIAAQAQSPPLDPSGRWRPARHAEDDWFDQVPGQHRLFFDTTTPEALGEAIFFASNYFTANRTGYGLADGDLAVILCVRHRSTSFAFSDAMWAKYAEPIAERAGFNDPRTKQPPVLNVYQAAGYGRALPNNGITLDALTKRGVRLAVCQLSTRGYATAISAKTGGSVDDVYKELTEHLVPGSHLVPAGIVAVDRAQERGYSLV
jgi:intracellular sulfur oxidation DsrE/DsrF family protein